MLPLRKSHFPGQALRATFHFVAQNFRDPATRLGKNARALMYLHGFIRLKFLHVYWQIYSTSREAAENTKMANPVRSSQILRGVESFSVPLNENKNLGI